MSEKIIEVKVDNGVVRTLINFEDENNNYICLTDIAEKFGSQDIIRNWLQNKNTIEFLGIWEKLNNKNFNLVEFHQIKNEAGLHSFLMSAKKWTTLTNAIGIRAKTGRYNSGTWAHKDIAMHFCTWVSPEFYLKLIQEFQRLKKAELEQQNRLEEWQQNRWLTKINYKLHTDAIKDNILPILNTPKQYEGCIYASEAEMLNKIVFGITSKEFKEKHPTIVKKGNMRDFAEKKVLVIITNLESANAKMIRDGLVKQEDRFYKLLQQANDEKKSFGITDDNLFQHNLFVSLDNSQEDINQLNNTQEEIEQKISYVVNKSIKK